MICVNDAYGAVFYTCEFDGLLIIGVCVSKCELSRRIMNHRSHVAGLSYAISLRRCTLSGPSASFTPYGIIFGLCMHVRLVSLKACVSQSVGQPSLSIVLWTFRRAWSMCAGSLCTALIRAVTNLARLSIFCLLQIVYKGNGSVLNATQTWITRYFVRAVVLCSSYTSSTA